MQQYLHTLESQTDKIEMNSLRKNIICKMLNIVFDIVNLFSILFIIEVL